MGEETESVCETDGLFDPLSSGFLCFLSPFFHFSFFSISIPTSFISKFIVFPGDKF